MRKISLSITQLMTTQEKKKRHKNTTESKENITKDMQ